MFILKKRVNDQPLFVPPQTNALYCAAFEEWATEYTNVKILSDQTTTNEVKTNSNQNHDALSQLFSTVYLSLDCDLSFCISSSARADWVLLLACGSQ